MMEEFNPANLDSWLDEYEMFEIRTHSDRNHSIFYSPSVEIEFDV